MKNQRLLILETDQCTNDKDLYEFLDKLDYEQYFCVSVLGSNAEQIHDYIDEVMVSNAVSKTDESKLELLTTWHETESELDEYIKAMKMSNESLKVERIDLKPNNSH